jgi:DNA-binding transcriptional regulator YdaS (Cro superfamily)
MPKNAAPIRAYIKRKKLSQRAFAAIAGVTPGMVSQWVTGRRQVSAERAKTIEIGTRGDLTRHRIRPDIFDRP